MKISAKEAFEAIQSGKFGVEVEMYNISREAAARYVANYFGTTCSVDHVGGYYDKWTCRDSKNRRWTFMSDASIQGANGGCEMVTPILGYNDMDDLQEVIRVLRRNGAKSDPAHECGIHVHVDAEGHTPATIRNLVNMLERNDDLILNAIGVGYERRRWCRPVDERFSRAINSKKPTTMDEVKRVWYEAQGYRVRAENEHYNETRYCILNLHSLWQGKGIEFRCFQFDNPTVDRRGGLHAGQLKAYIQLCLAMNEQAKRSSHIRNTVPEIQVVNPKKSMYKWMFSMAMTGDEFETARKLFIRRLNGRLADRVAA